MTKIVVPQFEDADACVFANILVREGENVTEGQVLAELEVSKQTMDLCAPCAGTVTNWVAEEFESYDSGTEICSIV